MGKRLSFTVLATAMMLAGTATAQESDGELTANVALTTNYIYRGVSQTDDGPAIQGGFDYTHGIFYAGTWASSVDFGDDTTMEIDFYGGLAPEWNTVTFDIGVLYYAYPDSPDLPTGSQNFVEVYGGASAPVGPFEVGGTVSYSPDFYGEIGDAFYYQATVGLDLTEHTGLDAFGIDAAYGFSRFDDDLLGDDYDDFNVGATASALGLDFDLRYFGTTGLAGNDENIVFTISKTI